MCPGERGISTHETNISACRSRCRPSAIRRPPSPSDEANQITADFVNGLVKDYVASTNGMLTLHFLPGYAPELNPDELVWSHMKRTGVARTPLRRGEKLKDKIEGVLQMHEEGRSRMMA
jgi:DDE superfamily endonuclease